MKHLATAALMLNLGAAGIYAQQTQQRPVKMTSSGSMVPTTINLGPNTITDEEHLAGNGTLGPFTLRALRTDETSPTSFGSCGIGSGPHFRVVAGGGVFRFQDGSLLAVGITGGALCIDTDHGVGHLTETYQIKSGTERFKGVSGGTLTLTVTLMPVVFNGPNSAVLVTMAGEFTGTISGLPDQAEN